MRGPGAITHPLVHKVSEVGDRASSLKKSLGKIRIRWQGRPEKKWLAELLADKRAVGSIIVYLKDTEAGGREGAVEKAIERIQRIGQEGEELL